MSRRRGKRERAERVSAAPRSARREGNNTEEGEDMDIGLDPGATGWRTQPRELVLFELVDEVDEGAKLPRDEGLEQLAVDLEAAPAAEAPPRAPRRPVTFEEPTNPEAVLDRLEAARALDPENVGLLVNLGWTLGLLGRFDEAERELRRAQKLSPDDIAVRAGVGLLSFRRGLYQQAESELRWVCEQDPEHGPAHFYRGEALNRLGRVDLALEMLERAAGLQPTNHRAFYTMGILYDRKNLPQQAAAMYRKARELQSR